MNEVREILNFTTTDSGKREEFPSGAQREPQVGRGRFDLLPVAAIRRFAQLLERGALKYADRNYEKGMKFSRYTDSALRHLFQFLEGDTAEDHLAAVLFNISAIMHHQDLISKKLLPAELDDLSKGAK